MIFWLVQQWSFRQPLAKQRYSKNTNDNDKNNFSALQKSNDVIYTGRSTYIEFIEGVQHFGFFRPSRIPEITFWVPERNSQVPSQVIIDPPKNLRAVPKSQPQKGLSSINKWWTTFETFCASVHGVMHHHFWRGVIFIHTDYMRYFPILLSSTVHFVTFCTFYFVMIQDLRC